MSNRCVLILLLWMVCGPVMAGSSDNPLNAGREGNFYAPHDDGNPNVEEYVWQEQQTELPAYPQDDNLIEFQVTRSNVAFDYYIDSDSLAYSPVDGIVRYTVVVRSKNGANNVAFEGMRCDTKEYKTYAYGNGRGEFKRPRKVEWKPLSHNHYTRYRKDLFDFYFCNPQIVNLSPERIIQELKYARPRVNTDGLY